MSGMLAVTRARDVLILFAKLINETCSTLATSAPLQYLLILTQIISFANFSFHLLKRRLFVEQKAKGKQLMFVEAENWIKSHRIHLQFRLNRVIFI